MRRGVYPGSFDPAHFGHIDIVTRAARVFEEVYVAVYDRPAKKLLFNVHERVAMLEKSLHALSNVKVASYSGLTVDYAKKIGAYAIIRGLRVFSDFELEFRMALANRRLAPEIEMVTFIADERHLHLSSSTVREVASLGGDVSSMAPSHICEALGQKFSEQRQNGIERDYVISLGDS
ncbi:MAG: pantetheine-phosphate adenylyltransferase [Anaerolineales bacterium]|nr:pantetheine-phosphate adenylyltransferase [Anaerolineales bacterium]